MTQLDTPFIVHTTPGSPYARAVMATLIEKHLPWRLRPVPPGGSRQKPYLDLQPFGRLPTLEHDGFILYETQAILRYLDRVSPDPALTPTDIRASARMDQVMNINDWHLFQGCGNIIGFQRIVGPALMGLTPDLAVIAEAMPRAHAVIETLSKILGDQTFLVGDRLSLADLLVAPQLDFLAQTPEWAELSQGRENLNAWLARLLERPSFQQTTWAQVSAMAKAMASA